MAVQQKEIVVEPLTAVNAIVGNNGSGKKCYGGMEEHSTGYRLQDSGFRLRVLNFFVPD